MARARLLSKTLSTSVCYARIFDVCPDLAEFAQSLYPLLIVHADDFGREEGDATTVKYRFHPRSPRPVEDFEQALEVLARVGLIVWYTAKGRRCFQIVKFDEHQCGLHKRTHSQFPPPPAGSRKFPEIPGNSGSIEEKRTEEKRTKDQDQDPRFALRKISTVYPQLKAAVHQRLDDDPQTSLLELTELLKDLGRPLGFTWNTSRDITKVVDSVLQERAKRSG